MRIGLSCKEGRANSHYRVIEPLNELERRGHAVCWADHPSYKKVNEGGTPEWDVLHVHQFIGEEDLALYRRLRAAGVAVVWDTDDDISQMPRSSPEYRRLGGKRSIRRHFERTIEIARTAHLMTTTSEHLAEVYRAAGVEHVAVIDNHLAPEDVARTRRRHAGIVIGCTAAGEHRSDLDRLRIAQALRSVLQAHDGVRVVTIGEPLEIRDPRYEHRPAVPIDRLLDLESDFDIGIAPLLDTQLNRCRSTVKLKEYAAAGAMWLASPVGPYVGMGEEQGGALVDEDEWAAALSSLVDDYRRRVALQERARTWVKGQSIRAVGDRWDAALRSAVLRARAEDGVSVPPGPRRGAPGALRRARLRR